MPTTRKQKKARKSRGLEILSDIENLDMMLGGDRYNGTERERSLDSNSVRRRESVIGNNLDNEGESLFSNCRNDEPRTSADLGQYSAEANSLAEINRLSSELNSRISREMDEMMSNVLNLLSSEKTIILVQTVSLLFSRYNLTQFYTRSFPYGYYKKTKEG